MKNSQSTIAIINLIFLIDQSLLGIIFDRQDQEKEEIFTDLSQALPSDETGPESSSQKSPYFAGGRKSGAFKRKRPSGKTGGERKLTKKGKWFGKNDNKRSSYSTSKSTGAASKKSSTPYKGAQASSSRGGLNLLAPPRPRTVKKE